MEKCNCCDNESIWAWQPFGPNEKPDSWSFLGSHYRGFPVIKICDECKTDTQNGLPLDFTYKGTRYIGTPEEVMEVPTYIEDALYFWERGGLPF